jgi:ectoine hydroxylase-related dioxygenase (phytanoyl-CoA dioxygenase family)
MNITQALKQLGVSENSLDTRNRKLLDEQGYFIIENVLSPEECAHMAAEVDRIAAAESISGGGEVSVEAGSTRVSNIFNKSEAFDRVLEIKPILASSHYLLGDFKIHGANVREPHQGAGQQPLHSDSVKLGDGRWCLVNALIAFDALTLENGSTRVVPGSHMWAPLNVPGENAVYAAETPRKEPHRWATQGESVEEHSAQSPVEADTDKAPADPFAPYPGEVFVVVPAGSIVVCNAHIWHSGTPKKNNARRRLLALSYTRRDLPQQLVQRDYLTPQFNDRLSDAQRYLLDVA